MGVSTDGILFYGYHLPEGTEISEELEDTYYSDKPVQVGYHCSGEYPMYYVFVKESQTTASRGTPKQIPSELHAPSDWDLLLDEFIREHKLLQPGAVEDEYGEPASEIGWWLTSYWG